MANVDLTAVESDLRSSCWCFASSDGSVIAPVLILLPDGTLGGYSHVNERSWKLLNGQLALVNIDGVTTSLFDEVGIGPNGAVTMTGRHTFAPHNGLMLQQLPALPQAMPDRGATPARFLHADTGSGRRNLVVINANENSLHNQWPRDVPAYDRNWDLCQCFYGRDPSLAEPPFEYLAHTPYGGKFRTVYDVFHPGSPLWNYDYIWIPDDDIACSWSDVNRMFELCRRYRLMLAQPALSPTSFIAHPILRVQEAFGLRFTNFVEIMCPVFSQDSLRTCIGTMRDAYSAHRLDMIWPKLLGDVPGRVAVIDAVSVTHTRPVGATYDMGSAVAEGIRTGALYGLRFRYQTYGGFARQDVAP
jgi:hypothetical protein